MVSLISPRTTWHGRGDSPQVVSLLTPYCNVRTPTVPEYYFQLAMRHHHPSQLHVLPPPIHKKKTDTCPPHYNPSILLPGFPVFNSTNRSNGPSGFELNTFSFVCSLFSFEKFPLGAACDLPSLGGSCSCFPDCCSGGGDCWPSRGADIGRKSIYEGVVWVVVWGVLRDGGRMGIERNGGYVLRR